ncbi:hypothetical protein CYY_005063 [Polysphondylium violaceum]|uniref:Uncharacterized protein n=1 Tax=Polysphondylium violaceum TaxID=133409 RepID=A0A8J4PX71_9MYCE|nr:hypothetical protein CYY_005063 [Polysphondylium violaceum]
MDANNPGFCCVCKDKCSYLHHIHDRKKIVHIEETVTKTVENHLKKHNLSSNNLDLNKKDDCKKVLKQVADKIETNLVEHFNKIRQVGGYDMTDDLKSTLDQIKKDSDQFKSKEAQETCQQISTVIDRFIDQVKQDKEEEMNVFVESEFLSNQES